MARFVEPERLWPLLAYFAGAVAVVIGADLLLGATNASDDAMVRVVVVWLVLTPVGAWMVWRRGARSGKDGG